MRDLIDRQAVQDLIIETDPYWSEGMTRAIYNGVSKLPSAKPEIKCIAKITMTDEQIQEAAEKATQAVLKAIDAMQPERNDPLVEIDPSVQDLIIETEAIYDGVSKLPSAQLDRMNDLISRQAAIEIVHSLYPSEPIMRMNRERWKERYKPYIEAEKALEMLPPAQSKLREGTWIEKGALLDTLEAFYKRREKDAAFTGNRGPCVSWNDAIYCIKTAPTFSGNAVYSVKTSPTLERMVQDMEEKK